MKCEHVYDEVMGEGLACAKCGKKTTWEELEKQEWEEYECVICKEKFNDFGNNPSPIKEEGRCCNICNDTIVVPTRIANFSR